MQDSQQVCINSKISMDDILGLKTSIKDSLITAETNTLELLGYGNKISNYFIESFLDRPVIDQVIFYLMLIYAKNRLDIQIKQVLDEKPELSFPEVLKTANNFVMSFDYVSQIIQYRNSAKRVSDSRIKKLAWELFENLQSVMLPTSSLNEISKTLFGNDLEDGITHKRLFSSISYFEHDDNSFIFYQLEEKVAESLTEIDYIKNGKYTAIDTLMVLNIKERLDLYMYNLMKINEFRREIVLSYADFKSLTEFSTEFKYRPSDFYHKRLLPALTRLNDDSSVELYIKSQYEPCNKRRKNRDHFCNYRFKISLKHEYSEGLNLLKSITDKIEDENGKKLNIPDQLFIAALRINDGKADKVVAIVKDRIAAYVAKHGPSYLAKNLNLIASYIVQGLEDLYKNNHFFERYLRDLKHRNGLMYLKGRNTKKLVIENGSNTTFSSEFLNIRDKVDIFTSEILISTELTSKTTDATVIIDYNFIRHSIFRTHPHLKHQRNADEQKYLDLVQESVKLCQVFFGMGNENEKSLTQTYLTDLLFEDFFEDDFHLNSMVLKKLLKKDMDYWKSNSKEFYKLWKMANEFSLQQGDKNVE
ncbi:hypothetical protein [Acinetobacter sp. YH01009]|uniref:hypothetical protein n=1 Tax=Acinetobacter sp. YH01009 TaxID=2601025 RepID=UPI0015D43C56|nr:hypothetical protein [Acinetobacter sp. YH01009]